jgi:hypothetical protein
MRVASRFRYTPRYGFSLLEFVRSLTYRWTGWPGYIYFESRSMYGSFVVRQLDVTSELFG